MLRTMVLRMMMRCNDVEDEVEGEVKDDHVAEDEGDLGEGEMGGDKVDGGGCDDDHDDGDVER